MKAAHTRGRIIIQKQMHAVEPEDIDIGAVSKQDLADAAGVIFDTAILKEQRAVQVLSVLKNPYCFRVGDMGVKLEFMDNAPALKECLASFLLRKKVGL